MSQGWARPAIILYVLVKNGVVKGIDNANFDRKMKLYSINYIYDDILTAQMCFNEPQFINII